MSTAKSTPAAGAARRRTSHRRGPAGQDEEREDLRFRGLLESAPDAMVIADADGTIVRTNRRAGKLFGYECEELLGQSVDLLVPPAGSDRPRSDGASTSDALAPRAVESPDSRGRRKDGSEFPIEISLVRIDRGRSPLVASAIRDVSESRRIEASLREANEALRLAGEAKDRFLAQVSHELRTPLNAIIGFTGTLLLGLPGPVNARQQQQLSTVKSSATHLLSLINDILDLAKVESGKVDLAYEHVDCVAVMEEVAAILEPAAKAQGIVLRVEPGEPGTSVFADRRALAQILMNLASNAIKFTSAHGVVTLSLGASTDGTSRRVLFRVTDTGRGIRTEDRSRLFQAFSRIDDRKGAGPAGTGLGLHLSQSLAAMMGGAIVCESEYGRGSTFTLSLTDARDGEHPRRR